MRHSAHHLGLTAILAALTLATWGCRPPTHDAPMADASGQHDAIAQGESGGAAGAAASASSTHDDVRMGPDGQRIAWEPVEAEAAPDASPRKGDASWAAELTSRIEGQWTQGATQRRLYLQVDKPLYNPGDSIWVRVWDVQTADLAAPGQTEGVTLELMSPQGSVAQSARVQAERGRAHHAFDIAKTDVGGEYTIIARTFDGFVSERSVFVNAFTVPRIQKKLELARKAYGPGDLVQADLELKASDGSPVANKEVTVVARVDGEELARTTATTGSDGRATVSAQLPALIEVGDGVLNVMVEDGGVTESVSKRIPIILKKIRFALYPEGGDLVLGLPSRVYFEAKRPMGKPADVEGRIVDDRGFVLTTFTSYRDGRGVFEVTPEAGRSYRAEITRPEGVAETFVLPDAKSAGCTLRSFDDFDGQLTALRVAVRCTEPQEAVVVATLRANVLDSAVVDVPAGSPAVVHLEPGDATLARAQGVARVTVFDSRMAPVAERVVYRNRRTRLQIDVAPDKARYAPREKVTLALTARDPAGEPVAADLALSVVDDAVVSLADDKTAHMLAGLLLTSDIDGEVEDPNFYFDLTERRSAVAMDLLMGTRGWRRFDWQPVLNPEPTSTLEGATGTGTEVATVTSESTAAPGKAGDKLVAAKSAPVGHADLRKRPAPVAPEAVVIDRIMPAPEAEVAEKRQEAAREIAQPLAARMDGNLDAADAPMQIVADQDELFGGDLGLLGEGAGGGGIGDVGFGGLGAAGRGKGQGFGGRIGGLNRRAAKLAHGAPQVAGALDANIIRRVVRQHSNELRYCYERELLGDPSLAGQIELEWSISPQGTVASVEAVTSSMRAPNVENCVMTRVKTWRFPAPEGGGVVVVKYPFVFTPDGDGAYVPPPSWVAVRQFPLPDYAAEANPAVRTDFRQTIFWSPTVSTDAQGHATVSFYLSDAVTTFRVFAEGMGGGAIGREEKTFASQLDFSMAAKIPTEVSATDRIDMPVTLTNQTDGPLSVALAANFGELLLPQGAGVPASVEVAAGASQSLFFPLVVGDGDTTTKARFSASTGRLSDAFERDVTVVPLGFPETVGMAGLLEGSASLSADLSAAVPGTLKVSLSLEPSPTASLLQGMEGMLREPSGCFEQTSSSNYPNTMVLSFMREHGAAHSQVQSQALDLLGRGYKRLVGFEVAGGGYEWFGRAPAHPALSAYGVLEFTDMKKVSSMVDQAMLDRTTRWLMALQDGQGGFAPPAGHTLHTWTAEPAYTNAYIAYALTEAGRGQDIGAAIEAQAAAVRSTDDPYLLALGTMVLFNVPGRNAEGQAAAERLAAMQGGDGGWTTAKISVVESRGPNLHIETTALAMMALMDAGDHLDAVVKGVGFLTANRQGYGRYGATQATVLALQALTRFAAEAGQGDDGGTVSVVVDGREVATKTYAANQGQPLVFEGLAEFFVPGKVAAVELRHKGARKLPFTLTLDYRTTLPNNSPAAPVHVETTVDKARVQMGENVQLVATLRNVSGGPVPMTVARIGFPGGLETQKWQLEELVDSGVAAFVETRAREAIVYLDGLETGQEVRIPLELSATIPGSFTAPATSAYLYYGDTDKHWAAPVQVEVGH